MGCLSRGSGAASRRIETALPDLQSVASFDTTLPGYGCRVQALPHTGCRTMLALHAGIASVARALVRGRVRKGQSSESFSGTPNRPSRQAGPVYVFSNPLERSPW